MSTRRTVVDRLISLRQAAPNRGHTTLALAEIMLQGLEGSEPISCTVNRHFRTRIFDFPGALIEEPVPAYTVYKSDSVRADLVCDFEVHLRDSESAHFAISPPFRQEAKEKREKLDGQRSGMHPYLVIQEVDDLEPVLLDKCALVPEVAIRDAKRTPLLIGGRDDASFVLAIHTTQGAWPKIPSNEVAVKTILAAARASQDAHNEIRKHIDQRCLVTDDNRFVSTLRPQPGSARGSVYSTLGPDAFRAKAKSLSAAIAKLEGDLESEHIELLVNALYWDDYKDDCFRRLHYLSLWQSLDESRKKLGYASPESKSKLIGDDTIVAGSRSLAELTQYRHDVAHWWKGSMDGNCLADIYRTLNELIRSRYFRSSVPTT